MWRRLPSSGSVIHECPSSSSAAARTSASVGSSAFGGSWWSAAGWSWMTDPDEGSLCACGEVLAPSLEYAGDAYRSHIARAALVAARKAARHE